MIENDELIFDGDAAGEHVRNGCDDAARREITTTIVVTPDDQDSRVLSASRVNQVTKLFRIVMVGG